MKAYKYRDTSERSLKILSEKKLYFPRAAQLNDPLDSQINIDKEYQKIVEKFPPNDSEEYLRKSFLIHLLNQHSFKDQNEKALGLNGAVQNFISTLGIYSLSRNATDALLWSHYGDSHTGMALEFETEIIDSENIFIRNPIRYCAKPVYQELFLELAEKLGEFVKPWESDHQYENGLGEKFYTHQLSQLMHANLFVKSAKWKYEEEFRLVSNRSGFHSFPSEALISVVFGLNSKPSFIRQVEIILSTPEYSHVDIKYVQHKTGSFEFEIANYNNNLMQLDRTT